MKQPIFTGTWGKCHIQGIAVDEKRGYIYYSFTTKLVKATLDGEIIGSLDGLVGHLGCIAFSKEDGRVYGSLEYKNDGIGKGILNALGDTGVYEDGFYIARFDVDKIDRVGIPAEGSDIMKCIYLSEVVSDYLGEGTDKDGKPTPHRYGCSGIDGTTIAPLPGRAIDSKKYLYVAYGIYSDHNRTDNDRQVILCYDFSDWDKYATPLDQKNMHKFGPEKPEHKFFVYTGNTTYGVQNLEFDAHTHSLVMAVYRGSKPSFPNYDLFLADLSTPAAICEGEGELLSLKKIGKPSEDKGICGWYFPHGSTGLYSFGNGEWFISENRVTTEGQCAHIYKYVWDGIHPFVTDLS